MKQLSGFDNKFLNNQEEQLFMESCVEWFFDLTLYFSEWCLSCLTKCVCDVKEVSIDPVYIMLENLTESNSCIQDVQIPPCDY